MSSRRRLVLLNKNEKPLGFSPEVIERKIQDVYRDYIGHPPLLVGQPNLAMKLNHWRALITDINANVGRNHLKLLVLREKRGLRADKSLYLSYRKMWPKAGKAAKKRAVVGGNPLHDYAQMLQQAQNQMAWGFAGNVIAANAPAPQEPRVARVRNVPRVRVREGRLQVER